MGPRIVGRQPQGRAEVLDPGVDVAAVKAMPATMVSPMALAKPTRLDCIMALCAITLVVPSRPAVFKIRLEVLDILLSPIFPALRPHTSVFIDGCFVGAG